MIPISIRDFMVRQSLAPDADFFTSLPDFGVDTFELDVRFDGSMPALGEGFSLDNLAPLKARLESENLRVAALLLATDFSAENAEAHMDWAVQTIYAAQEVGAPVVRIDTATRAQIPVEDVQKNFVRCIRRVLAETAETGVDLGIENHGHISNNRAFLDGIFAEVPDARLGLTLDTGNFYWYGLPLDELYETLQHFAPRARHTHMKSIAYPAETRNTQRETGWRYGELCSPLDEGDLDFKRVIQILRDAGYADKPTRTLCIENEALPRFAVEERADILCRDVAALRNAQ